MAAAPTRPVFGEKPSAAAHHPIKAEKREYKTAPKQESLDFLRECTPPLEPGRFFLTPRDVVKFRRLLESRLASDFLEDLTDKTFGAAFDKEIYGAAAAELAKPIKSKSGGKEHRHPRWAPALATGRAPPRWRPPTAVQIRPLPRVF